MGSLNILKEKVSASLLHKLANLGLEVDASIVNTNKNKLIADLENRHGCIDFIDADVFEKAVKDTTVAKGLVKEIRITKTKQWLAEVSEALPIIDEGVKGFLLIYDSGRKALIVRNDAKYRYVSENLTGKLTECRMAVRTVKEDIDGGFILETPIYGNYMVQVHSLQGDDTSMSLEGLLMYSYCKYLGKIPKQFLGILAVNVLDCTGVCETRDRRGWSENFNIANLEWCCTGDNTRHAKFVLRCAELGYHLSVSCYTFSNITEADKNGVKGYKKVIELAKSNMTDEELKTWLENNKGKGFFEII